MQIDDFAFSALSASEPKPGEYHIRLNVENRAKVVDFTFDPAVVKTSAEGESLKLDPASNGPVLTAGNSVERELIFRGRPGVRSIEVRIEFGSGPFLSFDRYAFGDRRTIVPLTRP